jgi:hypothetical protein
VVLRAFKGLKELKDKVVRAVSRTNKKTVKIDILQSGFVYSHLHHTGIVWGFGTKVVLRLFT